MKPIVSIGVFFSSEEDIAYAKNAVGVLGQNVHASFYAIEDFEWLQACVPLVDNVFSVHLPNGLTLKDYKKGGLVDDVRKIFVNAKRFVVHPWSDDLDSIVQEVISRGEYSLSLEIFPIRRSKDGNFIQLLARFGRYMLESDLIKLCIDLSHLDNETANYTVIKPLIPYTKIMHVSCRIDKKGHLPVFTQQSDVNARNVVGQVLNNPNVSVEEFVLEYDKEYRKQAIKHWWHFSQIIDSKVRRFGK